MQVKWAKFSAENIKWHILLDFFCCSNANMYSRMADDLSNGSNSSTFIGMQGKSMETRKTEILTAKKQKYIKSHLINKIYINSTEMYGTCVPPRIDTLSEQSMSYVMQPGACSARYMYWLVSAQQSWPIRNKNTKKGLTFKGALIFCCTLLVKTCCQNDDKWLCHNYWGVLQLLITMCISVGASYGILWPCIEWSKTEMCERNKEIP